MYDLALWLGRRGVAVDLIAETPHDPRRARRAEEAFPESVRLVWCRPAPLPWGRLRGTVVLDRVTNYPWWTRRLSALLAADTALVQANGLAGVGFVPSRAGRQAPIPLILVPHGMEEFHTRGRLKRLAYAPFRAGVRAAAAAADVVVAQDEVLRDDMRVALGLPDERLTVIANAVDGEACREQADLDAARRLLQESGLEAGGPLLVSVGRIAPNKGFELLAGALAREAARMPQGWRWVLVGDGPHRGRVEAAIRSGGIADRCRLLGRLDDATMHGVLAIADWFVHPTRFEGSSLVTLEALAHGLPVLGTRAGGLPDKVVEAETGFLVEPGSVEALARGLQAAAQADAPRLGAAGRRLLEASFGWDAILPRYLDLCREILASRAARGGAVGS